MKQGMKNEIDMLSLINKIQVQLDILDKKVDTLIHRSLPETKLIPKPSVNSVPSPVKPNDRNKGRSMFQAICADCKQECTIPFKPTGDRPIYCQNCFSRRKVIRLSGIKLEDKPHEAVSPQTAVIKEAHVVTAPVKTKKKATTVKKTVLKKKLPLKKVAKRKVK